MKVFLVVSVSGLFGKSFLGKGTFHPLLRVEFASPTGSDEAAWAVKEPEKWQAAIHDLRSS